MPDRDPFAFDDFFTQDYIATIEKVEFVVNDYDRLQGVFTNRYDSPVTGDDGEVRNSRTEWYNIGASSLWQPINGGTAFEHTSGDPDKRVRSDSGYGKLVMRGLDLLGREKLLARVDSTMFAGGIYAAQMWQDLRFHWVTEGAGERWENKKAGTSGISRGSQMPVEWLPAGEAQTALATFDLDSLGVDADTLNDLRTLAQGLSLGEFQGKGISLARDLQDASVRSKVNAALGDTSFYETLKATETVY